MRPSILITGLWMSILGAAGAQMPGLPPVPVPPENPITQDKALLGMALFWDEQLSSSRTIACGTCHVFSSGGADPRTRLQPSRSRHPGPDGALGTADDTHGSPGVALQMTTGSYVTDPIFGFRPAVTRRMSPSVINAAYAPTLFWDGRTGEAFHDPLGGSPRIPRGAALEVQALEPPLSSVEMAHAGEDWTAIARRITQATPLRLASNLPPRLGNFIAGRDYPQLFQQAFGTPFVSPSRIAMALATYQRTLVSDQSPWDDHLAGDPLALSTQQLRGRDVFFGAGRCDTCHTGPRFTDDLFHDLGHRPDAADLGRGAVTGIAADEGRFRTPSLRNVALRGPYFHDGSRANLGNVMSFYRTGGLFPADPLMQPANLSPSQRLALVAFMQALTDPRVATEAPPFDRPTLSSEAGRAPAVFGTGTPGSAGVIPTVIAHEPPFVGNPAFSVGVGNLLGGASTYLLLAPAPAGTPTTFYGASVFLALGPDLVVLPIGPAPGGTAPGEGHLTVTFDLTTSGLTIGSAIHGQWFVLDPGATHGLAATPAFRVQLF